MANDDIVTFLLPDGTEVSNDPRFQLEEMRAQMLASVPNTGHEGPRPKDQAIAQVPDAEGQQAEQQEFASGRAWQLQDRQAADERGVDPRNPLVTPPEPPDINEQITEAQAEDEGDGEPPAAGGDYENWSGRQLSAEVKRRGLELPDRKKSSAVAALQEDDKANSGNEPA